MPRIDLSSYIVVPIWFGCNNDCTLCMLSGIREQLTPVGLDRFEPLLERIREDGRYENLVLSGAEVTTCETLDRYVRMAASTGAFRKIQIQTNGRRLADRDYLSRLVDQGVNEFFVSIQGMEAAHDAITRVPGSFRETMAGLENLAVLDVNVIPNTVLTTANLQDVPRLVARLSPSGMREMHLWNYFPMERVDERGLIVRLQEVVALLPRLVEAVGTSDVSLVLKSFPECLPVSPPLILDSWFPVTVLPDAFWRRFEENRFGQCIHRAWCGDRECWGLSAAYIEKYGWEADLLKPVR